MKDDNDMHMKNELHKDDPCNECNTPSLPHSVFPDCTACPICNTPVTITETDKTITELLDEIKVYGETCIALPSIIPVVRDNANRILELLPHLRTAITALEKERDELKELLKDAQGLLYISCNNLEEEDWAKEQLEDQCYNRWFGQVNPYLDAGGDFRPADWIERMNNRPTNAELQSSLTEHKRVLRELARLSRGNILIGINEWFCHYCDQAVAHEDALCTNPDCPAAQARALLAADTTPDELRQSRQKVIKDVEAFLEENTHGS